MVFTSEPRRGQPHKGVYMGQVFNKEKESFGQKVRIARGLDWPRRCANTWERNLRSRAIQARRKPFHPCPPPLAVASPHTCAGCKYLGFPTSPRNNLPVCRRNCWISGESSRRTCSSIVYGWKPHYSSEIAWSCCRHPSSEPAMPVPCRHEKLVKRVQGENHCCSPTISPEALR